MSPTYLGWLWLSCRGGTGRLTGVPPHDGVDGALPSWRAIRRRSRLRPHLWRRRFSRTEARGGGGGAQRKGWSGLAVVDAVFLLGGGGSQAGRLGACLPFEGCVDMRRFLEVIGAGVWQEHFAVFGGGRLTADSKVARLRYLYS